MLDPEITPSGSMPVTLAYVKAQAAVDFDWDDGLLSEDIKAALDYLDGPTGIMGRAIMAQTVVQKLADFSCLRLPYGPASSITSIEYYDTDGNLQTVPPAYYTLLKDAGGSFIHFIDAVNIPTAYTRPDAVSVTYDAGAANANGVPSIIKKAIVVMIRSWYELRTGQIEGSAIVREVPFGVSDMLAPSRLVGV